jgi:hypothetical protein
MHDFLELFLVNLSNNDVIPSLINAFAAIVSAASSVFSLWIAVNVLKTQRKHNVISLMPIPEITHGDFEDRIIVKILNNGAGPLLIKKFQVFHNEEFRGSVIEFMPDLYEGRNWNNFTHTFNNRTLRAGSELVIIELKEMDGEENFNISRDLVRGYLAPLIIKVEYSDIYGTKMPKYEKDLSWYGRHND